VFSALHVRAATLGPAAGLQLQQASANTRTFFTVYTEQVHQHKAKPTQCDTTRTAHAVDACSSPDPSHPCTLPPARRTEPPPTDTMPTPTSNPDSTDPPPAPAGGSEGGTGADAPPALETRRRGRARRRPASTPAGDERAVKRWRSDECHELLKWLQQTSDHRANLQARNDVKGLNAQYQAADDHLAGRFPLYTGYTDARVNSTARYLQTAWKDLRKVINAERNEGAGTERIETLQGAFAVLLSLLTPLSTCVTEELWLDSNSMFPRLSCTVLQISCPRFFCCVPIPFVLPTQPSFQTMSSVKIFGVRLRRGRKRVRGKPVLVLQLPLQQGRRLETAAVALFLVDVPRIDATNRRPSRRTPPRDDLEM